MYRNAYVLLLLTTLFWGGNAVAGKLAVGHVSPMLLTCARWTGACLLLWLIGRRRLAGDMATVRAAFPMLASLGFIGFTIFNVALYAALVHTTAINVSIEQGGIPMLIFLLNFLLFRTRVTALQIAGLVMSVVGVALTASHGNLARLLELDVNAGDAIMLAALLAYSIYTVMLRRKPALHWQSLMIVLTAVGALTSLPFAVGEILLDAVIWPGARGWVILAYVIVFPSVLAQIFYIRGVELIGANRAGLFINLVPIFGTLLSLAILGEAFHPYHAAALVLVLGGIALSELGSRRRAA